MGWLPANCLHLVDTMVHMPYYYHLLHLANPLQICSHAFVLHVAALQLGQLPPGLCHEPEDCQQSCKRNCILHCVVTLLEELGGVIRV